MTESQNKIIVFDAVAIQKKIYTIRDAQVMLDSDLASFSGVETKALNQAVKRNLERFPEEFMFAQNENEWEYLRSQFGASNHESLRSQIVTSKKRRGKHRKYLPYVFTEQGVTMLSGVLTAVNISIQIKGKINRFSLYNMNSSFCVS
ncbi:MAG: hypothetical protein AUJ54_11765 [Ignavibacteria bacterium CG1_02_37_35]|nr:ORF6N domain-containing protein [Ignavibacteria bacterium]OIO16223.1 MAG: hypothetical protein AUJ54_11765 [Ignavibacteria bacterium CG1_02_37_35]